MSEQSTEQSASSVAMGKPSLINDPKVRAYFFQALLLVIVIYGCWVLFDNTTTNLAKLGVSSGFDFLNQTAGFGITTHLIDYSESSSYGRVFLVGLLNTIMISVLGIIAATLLGILVGVSRLSKNWLLSKLASIFIETFRNIPLLLQILFWYFVMVHTAPGTKNAMNLLDLVFVSNRGLYLPAPVVETGFSFVIAAAAIAGIAWFFLSKWTKTRFEQTGQIFPSFWVGLGLLIGLPLLVAAVLGFPLSWDIPALKGFNFAGGLKVTPEFVALWLALSIYTASFIAELVRAGIQSVSHGQSEAASALGLRSSYTLKLVVLPQALRVIIPPLTNQYLNLTKNSSLATAIAYPELVSTFAGTALNQTGQAIEILGMTMAVYLTLSLSISSFMNWYNSRVALVER